MPKWFPRRREKGREGRDEPEYRPSDVFAFILAALQIILPFLFLILLVVLIAYGLLHLLFF